MKRYTQLHKLLHLTTGVSLAVCLCLQPIAAAAGEKQQKQPETVMQTEAPGQTEESEASGTMAQTETQEQSETSGQTEIPAQTEGAGQSETPAQTEGAGQSETPAQTEGAGQSETPAQTEGTGQSETPGQTEGAGQSETPAQTEGAGQTEIPTQTEGAGQSETSDPAEGQEESEIQTEAQEQSEMEKASSDRAKLTAAIRTEEGAAVSVTAKQTPASVSCEGVTRAVDYADGVFEVTVPEDTETLMIQLGQTGNSDRRSIADKVFFARWNGYFIQQGEKWALCPDLLDADTALYSAADVSGVTVYPLEFTDGAFVLPLEKFRLKGADMTLEQRTVYGEPDADREYAEICIGTFAVDGSLQENLVLLVNFEENETENETETVSEAENEPFTESEDETELHTEAEDETELLTETESGTELLTESECETELPTISLFASPTEIEDAYKETGKDLASSAQTSIPQVGSINGEWHILGLVRSGQKVDPAVIEGYKANVLKILQENNGVLHDKKYTEYSRVVLALTALGEDVTNVGGYNLLEPLADFDQTCWQGVNGAVFALIAFDSHDYEIPPVSSGKTQTTREGLIDHILEQRTPDGGWAMYGAKADPDLTGMALQALAPYYGSNAQVTAAVDKALRTLSRMQKPDGTFSGTEGKNVESSAQVIVALTALGIDPNTDPRFVKNGKSAMDGLLSFCVSGGGFSHTASGQKNQMASEQGYYALVAYERFLEGKKSLYDMSDVEIKALSDKEKVKRAQELISAIGAVTLEKEGAIVSARAAYNALTPELQKRITNYDVLTEAEKTLAKLKAESGSGSGQNGSGNGAGGGKKPSGSGSGGKKPSGNKNQGGNRKPGGTTHSVNLTSGKQGGTTGGTKFFGYSEKKDDETAEKKKTVKTADKKSGGTQAEKAEKQAVASVIQHLTEIFCGTRTVEKLPENAQDYSAEQIDMLLSVYQDYSALSDAGKKQVEVSVRYPQFEQALASLGERNHYDEMTGTDLRKNKEEVLPWYVQLMVSSQMPDEERLQEIRSALGEKSEVFFMNEISFINTLNGEVWEPEALIRVRLPMAELGEYESAVVLHCTDVGDLEFIEGDISGEAIEFDAAGFSEYGVAGIMGTVEDLLTGRKKNPILPWAVGGGAASFLLFLLLLVRRCSDKGKGTTT